MTTMDWISIGVLTLCLAVVAWGIYLKWKLEDIMDDIARWDK